MRSPIRFGLGICFMILASISVLAQSQGQLKAQAPTPEVNIIVTRQAVRFAAPGEVSEWRLEITSQQGEVIFDSGPASGPALDWPLQNQQGEPVPAGLYAYTLTLKGAPGGEARTLRGYLILDRASTSDRVWVTSDSGAGVGAEGAGVKLKVLGGGETSLGGAELPNLAARPEPEGGPQSKEAKHATAQAKGVGEKASTPAAAAGTANRVAKFAVDGVSLIDSTVTETPAGDIGIGTTVPGGVFDLQRLNSSGDILQRLWNTAAGTNPAAGAKLRYVAATGATSQLQLTDNDEWLMAMAGNNTIGMQFRVRGVGTLNTEAQLNSSARMTILRNGNVGVGTTNPQGPLQINSAVTPLGSIPAGNNGLLLGSAGDTAYKWVQSYGGALSLNPQGNNVGIGTATPSQKLHVVGNSLFATSGINGVQITPASDADTGVFNVTNAANTVNLLAVNGNGQVIMNGSGNNSGHVGIGTTSPGASGAFLDVESPGLSDISVLGKNKFSTIANSGGIGVQGESVNGTGVRGMSTNGFALEAITPNTQIHFGTSAGDNGGYLVSTTASQAILSGGNRWNGTNWIATATAASSTVHQDGAIQFFTNGGLTAGNTFTPAARMTITSIGNVGINTTTPTSFPLQVAGDVGPNLDSLFNLGSASLRWNKVFAANGTIQTSDGRLKRRVTDLSYGLGAVMLLRPVSFEWKDRADGRVHLGLIAQEVERVIPEAVERSAEAAVPLGMDYSSLIPVTIKAIQEQQRAIQEQQTALDRKEGEVQALKAENAALNARLTTLEQLLRRQMRKRPGRPRSKP